MIFYKDFFFFFFDNQNVSKSAPIFTKVIPTYFKVYTNAILFKVCFEIKLSFWVITKNLKKKKNQKNCKMYDKHEFHYLYF